MAFAMLGASASLCGRPLSGGVRTRSLHARVGCLRSAAGRGCSLRSQTQPVAAHAWRPAHASPPR